MVPSTSCFPTGRPINLTSILTSAHEEGQSPITAAKSDARTQTDTRASSSYHELTPMGWVQQVVEHHDITRQLKQRLSDVIGEQHLITVIGSFIGNPHEQIGCSDILQAYLTQGSPFPTTPAHATPCAFLTPITD